MQYVAPAPKAGIFGQARYPPVDLNTSSLKVEGGQMWAGGVGVQGTDLASHTSSAVLMALALLVLGVEGADARAGGVDVKGHTLSWETHWFMGLGSACPSPMPLTQMGAPFYCPHTDVLERGAPVRGAGGGLTHSESAPWEYCVLVWYSLYKKVRDAWDACHTCTQELWRELLAVMRQVTGVVVVAGVVGVITKVSLIRLLY